MDILYKGTLIKDVYRAQDHTGYIANGCEFYPAEDCEIVKKDPVVLPCKGHALESAKEEKADRYNKGKTQWGLVDFQSLKPMVDVLEFGANKYSAHNWKKGLDTTEICESMMRHLTALMDGEDIDPESGLPHMGHIQCNTMFYNYMIRNNGKSNKNKDD